jgi:hypothetical protein
MNVKLKFILKTNRRLVCSYLAALLVVIAAISFWVSAVPGEVAEQKTPAAPGGLRPRNQPLEYP